MAIFHSYPFLATTKPTKALKESCTYGHCTYLHENNRTLRYVFSLVIYTDVMNRMYI